MTLINYQAHVSLTDTYLYQNCILPELQAIVEKMGLNASDFSDDELIELAKDWKL